MTSQISYQELRKMGIAALRERNSHLLILQKALDLKKKSYTQESRISRFTVEKKKNTKQKQSILYAKHGEKHKKNKKM